MIFKKRAMESLKMQLIYVFSFITVIAVLMVPTLQKINLYQNNNIERAYLAKDMAFIIETSYASQGLTTLSYPITKFNFAFQLDKDKITLIDPEDDSQTFYRFFSEENIPVNPVSFQPLFEGNIKSKYNVLKRVSPIIKKDTISVELLDQEVASSYQKSCGDAELPKLKNIMLDIGYGETNELSGFDGKIKAWEILFRIGKTLYGLDNELLTTKGDFDSKLDLNLPSRIEKAASSDFILSLYFKEGNREDGNILKAYIPFTRDKDSLSINKKIACELINNILEKTEKIKGAKKFDGSAIVIENTEMMPQNNPKQILGSNKYSVYLELGNIKSDSWPSLFSKINENPSLLAEPIIGVLNEFED